MSAHVSALLQRHVQGAAGSHVAVRTATARFGAPYIACEASYAVAAHAVLDVWAHEIAQPQTAPDAVLIGCFGDPGLMALRESIPVPVTGLAEASFIEAARHGRFAIVTGGERWGPMLQRLAQALGHAHALAGIHTATGGRPRSGPCLAGPGLQGRGAPDGGAGRHPGRRRAGRAGLRPAGWAGKPARCARRPAGVLPCVAAAGWLDLLLPPVPLPPWLALAPENLLGESSRFAGRPGCSRFAHSRSSPSGTAAQPCTSLSLAPSGRWPDGLK